MAQYKLTYFNVKGVSEPIRYLLAYGGVNFEDERIERDDWAMMKQDKPFGQLPILDTGEDFILTQSLAIARFLGKTFNLTGKDNVQDAQLDALVDHMQDLHWKLYASIREAESAPLFARNIPANTSQSVAVETFAENVLPFYFNKFNALARGGAFYGSNITWADVYFAGFIDCMETRLKKEILEPYPYLQALKAKIDAVPEVQDYLERRPFCDF